MTFWDLTTVVLANLLPLFLFEMTLAGSLAITAACSALLCLKRRFVRNALWTLPRDIKGIYILLTLEYDIARVIKRKSTIASLFLENVAKFPHKTAFVDVEQRKKLTFTEMNFLCNQMANFFALHAKVEKGDAVAIFMSNSVDYVALWLGLSKLGAVSSLINNNLRLKSLGHCISVSKAKFLVVDPELQSAVQDAINGGYISGVEVLIYGGRVLQDSAAKRMDDVLMKCSTNEPKTPSDLDLKSILMYIFTSGTTGLPKAAVLTNARFYMLTKGAARSFGIKAKDSVYVSMPLYHTLSGVAGAGMALVLGSTVVIRKKFSASKFWDDCLNYDCTVAQYIGEICRYLLAQPQRPQETRHKVRLMYGNGLRAEIWRDFTARFCIKKVGELYASTEGNTSLVNIDSKVGACGFFPIYPYIYLLYPLALIKINETTGELVRNKDGMCVRCKPGEYGEMVGKIIKGNPVKEFRGYLSVKETNKKLIRNVFNEGDVAFSSGDILYMDELGYLYFKDRTGDTFRWKGENVSTREVEGTIHKIIGLNDATVYGVEIPGIEGKAGMAAMADEDDGINLRELSQKLSESLPVYARPVFLRFCDSVETTGTYKLQKLNLQRNGFDPSKCNGDKLFYLNPVTGDYEILTNQIFEQIIQRQVAF